MRTTDSGGAADRVTNFSTFAGSCRMTNCVVPYESLSGKKDRDLDIFLRRRMNTGENDSEERGGDLSGKSQPERTT